MKAIQKGQCQAKLYFVVHYLLDNKILCNDWKSSYTWLQIVFFEGDICFSFIFEMFWVYSLLETKCVTLNVTV